MAQAKRSPHPGVVLLKPRPEHQQPHWRARYVDPDSGKQRTVTIPRPDARTKELRKRWAVALAKKNERRRLQLEQGAPRQSGASLESALEHYFEAKQSELRPATLTLYRRTASEILRWARRSGVASADHLILAKLQSFRAWLIKQPKWVPVPGGRRGQYRRTNEKRSAHSINRELRAAAVIFEYLRRSGLAPMLTRDAIRDGLQKQRAPREAPDYLRPAEIRALLDACHRHDAERFAQTRAEHAGGRPGTTPKYTPIGPFVAVALLSGMRVGEIQGLRREWVDGSQREIRLPAAATKTSAGRVVDLNVAPSLLSFFHAGAHGPAFNLSRGALDSARKRLIQRFGAPDFNWHQLRRTTGTYLTNAPAIFGAASVYMSARQLGHSVQVAERHYLGVHRRIPTEARTLEAAMQAENEITAIIEQAHARQK